MKNVISVFLSIALVFSLTLTTFAKSDNANAGNSKNTEEKERKNSSTQKQFKSELNDERKDLIKQKTELNQKIEQLQADYEACMAAGDTAGAEAALSQIQSLNQELEALKSEIKETINERYMIVKTLYTEEELKQFSSAAQLIEQMYQDASALGAASVTVNNNIIKFEAPPYIKGGKTIVPVRAITEGLGAEVSWDPDTNTATITKDNTTVLITIGSTTAYVDGNPIETTAPETSCGKTYIPLRFLAETFGFDVTWDDENEIIDIEDDQTDEEPVESDAGAQESDAGAQESDAGAQESDAGAQESDAGAEITAGGQTE